LIQHSPKLSPALSLFRETDQGDLASPLHRHRQHTLMLQAIAGNATGNNSSTLGQKIPQQADILEINRCLIHAKPAGLAALKKSATAPSAVSTISSFHDRLRLLELFVFV
jgi:hypothetical protein